MNCFFVHPPGFHHGHVWIIEAVDWFSFWLMLVEGAYKEGQQIASLCSHLGSTMAKAGSRGPLTVSPPGSHHREAIIKRAREFLLGHTLSFCKSWLYFETVQHFHEETRPRVEM